MNFKNYYTNKLCFLTVKQNFTIFMLQETHITTIEIINLHLFLNSICAAIYVLKTDLLISAVCILLATLGNRSSILF